MQTFLSENVQSSSSKGLMGKNKRHTSFVPQELLEETCLSTNILNLSLLINISAFQKVS